MDSVIRLDIACSPCYARQCSHQSCLKWLGAEVVMAQAAEQMMKSIARRSIVE
jgi:hypothetical protein